MNRPLVLSLIDQALTSGWSFGVMTALVAFTNPMTVGHFALYAAALLIAVGLHGALITTPMNVMLPGRDQATRAGLAVALARADTIGRLVAAGLAALVAGLLDGWTVAPLAAALVAATLWRETERARAIGIERMDRCLAIDAVAIGVTLVVVAGALLVVAPVPAILSGMAVGSAAGALVAQRWAERIEAPSAGYGAIWGDARYGLIGALATEAQDRGYVFLVGFLRGEAAVGVLQAGRILSAPLSLAGTAWGRVARPRMTRMIAAGDRAGARRELVRGLVGLTLLAGAVFLALALFWPWIEARVLRGQYEGIAMIAAVWAGHALAVVLTTAISFHMQAEERFEELARVSFMSCAVALSLVLLLGFGFPILVAAYGMLIGELVGLVWMAMLVFARREAGR